MAQWKHKADITTIVKKYEAAQDKETIVKCGKEIAAELREKLPVRYLKDLDDILEDFDAGNIDTPEEMNYAVHEMYEWGDLVKIWLGEDVTKRVQMEEELHEPLEGTGE